MLEYKISSTRSLNFKNIPEVAKFRIRIPPEDTVDDTLVEWDGASKDDVTAGYQVIRKIKCLSLFQYDKLNCLRK